MHAYTVFWIYKSWQKFVAQLEGSGGTSVMEHWCIKPLRVILTHLKKHITLKCKVRCFFLEGEIESFYKSLVGSTYLHFLWVEYAKHDYFHHICEIGVYINLGWAGGCG